jgi:hypothetical protein
MNSRRLISCIGFLRTELSKLGRSQPVCARLKGYHPEGAADRLLHCGISAPPPTGLWQRWVISSGPGRSRSRAHVRCSPGSYQKSGILSNPAHHGRPPAPKRTPWNKGKPIGATALGAARVGRDGHTIRPHGSGRRMPRYIRAIAEVLRARASSPRGRIAGRA